MSSTRPDDRRGKRRDRDREAMLATLGRLAGDVPVVETLVAATALAVTTAYLALGTAAGEIALAAGLAGHAGACALAALWAWSVARRNRDLRLPVLAVGATLCLGPFGAGGTALAVVLFLLFRRNVTGFEEWYAALFPEQKVEAARALFQEVVGETRNDDESAASVASFADILEYGTVEQMQALLALVATYFKPAFAPALKIALAHREPAIRVQAATAVAQIEQRFLRRSIDLESELKRRPKDAAVAFAAARHYDDYAFTGLLDEDRQEENRKRAFALYHAALTLRPEDGAIELAIGRLLVRMGDYRTAASLLALSAEAGRLRPAGTVWYLECLFRLGAFAKLREAAARIVPLLEADESADPRLRDAARLWLPERA